MVVGACGSQWAWTFGDPAGAGDFVKSPLYKYASTGTYKVTLLVSNSAGSSTTYQMVTVVP
jgi:PKD repeat protein